jgi:DNA-binding NarL/FixJ family response regulator
MEHTMMDATVEGRGRGEGEEEVGHENGTGPAMIRLLLVDDQPQVLRGLRMRLSLESDVVVVGEALNATAALSMTEQLQPDVIIMDVELPGMDGIAATEILRKSWPGTQVVMLSLHDDEATQARARAAGASAFVPKHRMEGPLLSAVRGAAEHASL